MFDEYFNAYGDEYFAFKQLCAKTGWYYDKTAFDSVKSEYNMCADYVTRLNAGKIVSLTYEDNIKEDYKSLKDTEKEIEAYKTRIIFLEFQLERVNDIEKSYSADWLGDYTSAELKYLDNYYNRLMEDYKIITENHRDYARKIAKASLYMDNCFNDIKQGVQGAASSYDKAREAFDKLCASAKFSEASRSINDVGLGSFGKIVEKVERKEWIYKHTPIEKDRIDELLDYFKTVEKSL